MANSRSGITIIELLVVTGIIVLLAGLTIPAVLSARQSARKTECLNNLRQIGVALTAYEGSNKTFPSGHGSWRKKVFMDYSWSTQILPWLDQTPLYEQFQENIGVVDNSFGFYRPGFDITQPVFSCPSSTQTSEPVRSTILGGVFVGLSDYVGLAGIDHTTKDGVLYFQSKTKVAEIKDGLSNTFMVGERPPSHDGNFGWIYSGYGQGNGNLNMFIGVEEKNAKSHPLLRDLPTGPYTYKKGTENSFESVFHFWSHHPGGAQFLRCDGSVTFFGYDSRPILKDLSTINGGELSQTN